MRHALRPLLAPYTSPSFRRFLAVGLSNFLISYGCFAVAIAALSSHAWRASLAQVVSYGCGMAWSYFWNRRWAFESRHAVAAEGTRFIATQLTCLIVSSASIGFAVDRLGLPPTLTWFLVMGPITLLNFALLRSWVFRNLRSGGPLAAVEGRCSE
jgi:putative flippase GtrA